MLEVLIAKENIRDLLARYCLYIDTHEYRKFAELFILDGEWTFGPTQASGVDDIERLMIERVPSEGPASKFKHLITNMLIDVDGDQASATMIFLVVRPSEAEIVLALAGTYNCRMVCAGGRWFFRDVVVHSAT